MRRIFLSEYMCVGSGIQPFNAWLLLRGLRTLPARLERIQRTTDTIWKYLRQHPKVESVIYPFDPAYPQYALAKQQMGAAPGLLSFYVTHRRAEEIEAFCDGLKHFKMAVSWGGHESLLIPKLATMPREAFDAENRDHRMIRIYVGLEDADYLIRDLERL